MNIPAAPAAKTPKNCKSFRIQIGSTVRPAASQNYSERCLRPGFVYRAVVGTKPILNKTVSVIWPIAQTAAVVLAAVRQAQATTQAKPGISQTANPIASPATSRLLKPARKKPKALIKLVWHNLPDFSRYYKHRLCRRRVCRPASIAAVLASWAYPAALLLKPDF